MTARIVARPKPDDEKAPAPVVGLDWSGVLVPGMVYEIIDASGVLLLIERGVCAAQEKWDRPISKVLDNAAPFLLTGPELVKRARRQAEKDLEADHYGCCGAQRGSLHTSTCPVSPFKRGT